MLVRQLGSATKADKYQDRKSNFRTNKKQKFFPPTYVPTFLSENFFYLLQEEKIMFDVFIALFKKHSLPTLEYSIS
jgi:hypothetical protein